MQSDDVILVIQPFILTSLFSVRTDLLQLYTYKNEN